MRSILFLGDSLTAGEIGSSYLNILKNSDRLMEFNLINAGENGYTMAGLHVKLEDYLNRNSPPDILVVEGGANDILLPYMQSQDSSWLPFIRKLTRHGSTATASTPEFRKKCGEIVSVARKSGISHVFLCTIPCLGEDLDSDLNKQRSEYNRTIRDSCREHSEIHCICLDTAQEVEKTLGNGGSRWLFKTAEDFQRDAQIIREKGEATLCRERGLQLTIDGAHLNRKGAELFSSLILKYLKEESLIF